MIEMLDPINTLYFLAVVLVGFYYIRKILRPGEDLHINLFGLFQRYSFLTILFVLFRTFEVLQSVEGDEIIVASLAGVIAVLPFLLIYTVSLVYKVKYEVLKEVKN